VSPRSRVGTVAASRSLPYCSRITCRRSRRPPTAQALRDEWQRLGWERSFLRYPVSDEGDTPGGRVSFFEGGKIEWTPAGGAVTTRSVKFDDD